jgi:hypothetical protein
MKMRLIAYTGGFEAVQLRRHAVLLDRNQIARTLCAFNAIKQARAKCLGPNVGCNCR